MSPNARQYSVNGIPNSLIEASIHVLEQKPVQAEIDNGAACPYNDKLDELSHSSPFGHLAEAGGKAHRVHHPVTEME
jgi:hypothetical protein